jgi:hypothetical protein
MIKSVNSVFDLGFGDLSVHVFSDSFSCWFLAGNSFPVPLKILVDFVDDSMYCFANGEFFHCLRGFAHVVLQAA